MKIEKIIYEHKGQAITRILPGTISAADGKQYVLVSDLIHAQCEVAAQLLLETETFDAELMNFAMNVAGKKTAQLVGLLNTEGDLLTSYRRGVKKPSKEKWTIIRYVLRALLMVAASQKVTHACE